MDEKIINEVEKDVVKISDDVVAVIAGLAVNEINGIVGMASGIVEGFTKMISGKKNAHKGVKVTISEEAVEIDFNVIVEYGVKIHEVCAEAQVNVKKAVETMTGMNVSSVNIYVQNVIIPKNENEEAEEVEKVEKVEE